jgi:hypothetical protein
VDFKRYLGPAPEGIADTVPNRGGPGWKLGGRLGVRPAPNVHGGDGRHSRSAVGTNRGRAGSARDRIDKSRMLLSSDGSTARVRQPGIGRTYCPTTTVQFGTS